MRKLLSLFSVLALFAVAAPSLSLAQTTAASSSIQAQLDLLASLTAQVQALQQQLLAVQQQRQSTLVQLVSTLRQGSQGDQVKVLQALLASNPSIFPEGSITGFFGPATARAVKRFQKLNGLAQVGNVGPKTLEKLNELLDENPIAFESTSTVSASTSVAARGENSQGENDNEGHGRPCAIVPPGHLIAPGWLRKHGDEKPIVPPCQTLPPGILEKLGLTTSTFPMLSGIVATPGTSTAMVNWTTNVAVNSQVMYGLTSAYGSSTALDSATTTSHSEMLAGLTPGTIYHFQVKSVDASSDIATSADMTFTTNVLPALPTLSGISSSAASTTATVSWTTNVLANGTVFYSTTAPVAITSTSTPSVSTTTLSTSHSLNLTGLTASTTYFYALQSTDGSSNTVTSTQQTFTTTQ